MLWVALSAAVEFANYTRLSILSLHEDFTQTCRNFMGLGGTSNDCSDRQRFQRARCFYAMG